MKAPTLPRKPLADLSATDLRKLYEKVQAYNSFLTSKLIEAGLGHIRHNDLHRYAHITPYVESERIFSGIVAQPVLEEMRRREAWHGDQYKRITVRRNPMSKKVGGKAVDNDAARELEFFISNNRELQLYRVPEFVKNVARKMKRGTFDPEKSVKLWRYLVDEAAKLYAKEYSVGSDWASIFTVPTRNAVAAELAHDYAQQIKDGNWSHVLDAAKIKLNPASRSGVRIVHNKLLGGWYVVRGPHQTPISGRFDSKVEAQAWLNRNKSNPAARKKKVAAKKKTATRKKTAAKKKTTARKKIAVIAKSRATGKAPSARLKKRRARNTVPGAYPNPAKRKGGSVIHLIYALSYQGGDPGLYLFDGHKFVPAWAEGKRYGSKAAAMREIRRITPMLPPKIHALGAFPATQSDSAVFREFTGKFRGMGK